MATQYITYAKKCLKIFFPKLWGGGGMAPFGQGVATPMGKYPCFAVLRTVF